MTPEQYAGIYRSSLMEDVLPFWEKYSIDTEHGGFFTCLDADGNRFDTDKFVWLQARQVWMFSKLYNDKEQKAEWLKIAKNGAVFLDKHAFDKDGDCYFSLTREGKPLVQAYNIFSDCFIVMAFAQYGIAAKDDYFIEKAKISFQRILARKDNPKGKYTKTIGENRALKNFALPMILSNLVMELKTVLSKEEVDHAIDLCVNEITTDFLTADIKLIYENVTPEGELHDSFEGRLINPGHGIEACWFLMDIAHERNDQALMTKMIDVCLNLIEYGWDEKYGGIFYFLDAKGYPPQQLEWDQKLWWVHLETLVALAKGFRYTGDQRCMEWFEKVHNYAWSHFRDERGGLEWYGYLNRQGEVLLPLKGGKWKGCFHVPRALFAVSEAFDFVAVNKK